MEEVQRLLLPVVTAALLALGATGAGAAVNDPARAKQWNLDQIGAETAWSAGDGTGVVVAVIDSGVDLAHEELVGKLVPGHDFVDDDDIPQDAFGHGTHVAGIVAASTGNGKGVAGVAPGAKVMPLRVLDADGGGTLDDVVAAVRWAVSHDADVVNLSLGEDTQALLGPGLSHVLTEAWDAGVVPVVSAGNQFFTGSGFSDEPVLVVAATDRSGGKPTYSSGTGAARWGLAAPGGELPDLGVEGSVLSTYWNGKEPNRYAYLSGTSQAAPHVAGGVAVLLSTGRFSPRQAVDRLLTTARDAGAKGKDTTFGAGVLDLAAATAGIRPAAGGAPAAAQPGTAGQAGASPPATAAPTAPPTSVLAPSFPGLPAPTAPAVPAPGGSATDAPGISASDSDPQVALPAQPPEQTAMPATGDGDGDDDETGVEGPLPWIAALLALGAGAAAVDRRRRLT